jgi:hypothetical protein
MFSNSKISLYNWVVIGLMAITFIVFAKMIFSRYKVPGVSEVVAMA